MLAYVVVTVFTFIGNVLATIGHIVGCPVDRIGRILHDSYRTMTSAFAFLYSALMNVVTGRVMNTSQGYELVPSQEQPSTDSNSYDAEAGLSNSSYAAHSTPTSNPITSNSNVGGPTKPSSSSSSAPVRMYQREHNNSKLLAQFESNKTVPPQPTTTPNNK